MAFQQPSKMLKVNDEDNKARIDQVEQSVPLHPLKIDVVLDKLFWCLNISDLSNSRLVCKQWYHKSFTHWLKAAPEQCLESPARFGNEEIKERDVRTSMSYFLSMVQNPFHTYDFYEYRGLRQFQKFNFCLGFNLEKEHSLFSQFFIMSGQFITELDLWLKFYKLDMCQAVIFSKLTPNLKKLKGRMALDKGITLAPDHWKDLDIPKQNNLESFGLYIYAEDYRDLPVDIWVQIFRHYTNLQDFHQGIINKVLFRRIIEAAKTTLQDKSGFGKLKSFNLDTSNYAEAIPEQLEFFRACPGLTLEEFGIAIPYEGKCNQKMVELLRYLASTLPKLVIYNDGKMLHDLELPRMDHLHTLKLLGYPFCGIGFLKNMSNLKILDIQDIGSANEDEVTVFGNIYNELDHLVLGSLATFHCDYTGCTETGDFDADDVRKLAYSMPSLKDLRLCLTNMSFKTVCRFWRKLEHLDIVGWRVQDEAFIGGPQGSQSETEPNITWLTELKSFRQLGKCSKKASYANLTEASVEFGLLKLPYLIRVQMCLRPEFDESILEQLKLKVPDVAISTGPPPKGSPQLEYWAIHYR